MSSDAKLSQTVHAVEHLLAAERDSSPTSLYAAAALRFKTEPHCSIQPCKRATEDRGRKRMLNHKGMGRSAGPVERLCTLRADPPG